MVKEERKFAAELFMHGVQAASPGAITRKAVLKYIEHFESQPVTIIATGKASLPMVSGAFDALGRSNIVRAIAVTNRENLGEMQDIDVFPAGHPVPDQQGLSAAEAVIDCASSLTESDVLLFLVSGGTSAMLPAPAGELTLDDEISATQALLASGAPIDAVNAIRSNISKIKGGGLSAIAGKATVVTLMLSDVPGDDPAVIGSGPTIPTRASSDDLAAIISTYDLDQRLSKPVLNQILHGAGSRPPELGLRVAEVIGSNKISLDAVISAAQELGHQVEVISEWLDGDVDQAAQEFTLAAGQCKHRPAVLVAGGETTVQLVGDGMGGRNQELALRFAKHARELSGPWVFLSGGTDGRDGPTDAAGGLVDHTSLSRIGTEAVEMALANNDTYRALERSGDLHMTGATGTNVADLQILLLL